MQRCIATHNAKVFEEQQRELAIDGYHVIPETIRISGDASSPVFIAFFELHQDFPYSRLDRCDHVDNKMTLCVSCRCPLVKGGPHDSGTTTN